jgi:hypothetical protein
VFELVRRQKGTRFVTQRKDLRLAPTAKFFERPLLGSVRADRPKTVEEQLASGVDIEHALVQSPHRTVILRVRGDGTVDAGLRELSSGAHCRESPRRNSYARRDAEVAHAQPGVRHLLLAEEEQFGLAMMPMREARPAANLGMLGTMRDNSAIVRGMVKKGPRNSSCKGVS